MRETLLWATQRITAALLLAGLSVHFYLMHFMGDAITKYNEIIERLGSPGWRVFNTLLLLSAVFHGMYGLWGIAIEYIGHGKVLAMAKIAIVALSLGLAAMGINILTLG